MTIFRSSRVLVPVVCLLTAVLRAQVVAPGEIKDPKMRALQTKHFADLTAAAAEISSHGYPAKFYLTRDLDLKPSALPASDHRAIEFTMLEKQAVLRVRGNYTAAYPTEMTPKDRVSRTFLEVGMPILKAMAATINDESELEAVVIELSHHVRKINVVTIDRFENAMFVLPRTLARKVAGSSDPAQQLAALNEGRVYIDGRMVAFEGEVKIPAPIGPPVTPAQVQTRTTAIPLPAQNREDLSTAALQMRQLELQPVLDRVSQELGPLAHFDPSHQASMIAFRGIAYVRLPLLTNLAESDAGSQYRLAALAFDRHISHLVRSILPYLKSANGLAGVAFRTRVNAGNASDSVEFLFPMAELRRYESYDITGQQLINAGFVLINGERVGLDLQQAESYSPEVTPVPLTP